MTRQTIDQQINDAQVAIDNALGQTEISAALAEYMYDTARLNEGKTLLTSAQKLHATQQAEYGDQFAATDTLTAAWDEARAAYGKHVKLARIALKKNRDAWKSLELDGRRKQTLIAWIGQATLFYQNALPDEAVKAALAEFGVSQAKLEAGQALVQAVVTANSAQEKEKGEAQQATIARDEALEALADWLDVFKQIAIIALEDQPQLLESLGFGAV